MEKEKMTNPIPTNWKQVKLGNISSIISGGTPSTEIPEYWDGNINWITPTEIVKIKGKYILRETKKKITTEGLNKSSASLIPENSLILCSRATVGSCAINKFPITTNQGFKNIIPNEELLIDFLYYKILLSKNYLTKISSGSTFLEFSKKDIEKFSFILPPLPEQHRIVAVLERWDKALETLTQKIKLKKNIKKGLMQELLTGKRRLPGFSGEWKIVPLRDAVNIVKKGVPIYEGLKKYYSTSAVLNEDKMDLVSYDTKPSRANMYPEIKDIGIAKMKGTNRCFILEEKWFGNIFSTGFSFLRTKKDTDYSFIYYLISDEKFQYFKDLYSASGIMGGIGDKDLLSIEIKIPKLKEEQTAIAQILTTANNEITALETKKQILEDQKKYLLNNLITGKIRTPENLTMNNHAS